MSYWIIKARPDRNDFAKFPLRDKFGRWYATRIPKDFRADDTVFIWAAAPVLQVIGQALVTSPDDGSDGKLRYFRVQYASNLIEGPTISFLRADSLLKGASFLKSGPAGTIFRLSEKQGAHILRLLASLQQLPSASLSVGSKPTVAEEKQVSQRLAGLFGDPEINRRVEVAAVEIATRFYTKLGWSVKSFEDQRCGYDLRCRKAGEEIHVEVKGIGGSSRSAFVITEGEYRKAAADSRFELCLVTSALAKSKVTTFRGGEIFRAFEFVPLAYKARLRMYAAEQKSKTKTGKTRV